MQASLIGAIEVGDTLGEGVLWRDSDSSVWWTDILGRRLHRLGWPERSLQTWQVPEPLCSFAFIVGDDDWLLAAFAPGFALYRPRDGALRWLARPASLTADMRLNDGRVDPRGRFWAGSMGEPPFRGNPRGRLYRLEGEGRTTQWRERIGISNALCWSPGADCMYFADTLRGRIERAAVDPSSGDPGPFSDFVEIEAGAPDGAVTDAAGNLWCAIWGGGRVDCFSPQGQRIASIAVPAPQATCPAFGGPGHSLLFVTSARVGLDAATLAEWSQSGALFVFETATSGLPARRAMRSYLDQGRDS